MNPIETYLRERNLPQSARACPELESLVLLDVAKRYPGMKKGLMTAAALGVLGRELDKDRMMLTYIDSLVSIGLLYRHQFGYHLTPSGVRHLEQLKSSLRGPLMRVLA